jgi:hypothetical protein
MARKASSKPDSGFSSTATIGFGANCCSFGILHSDFIIYSGFPGSIFNRMRRLVCPLFIAKLVFVRKCRAGAKFELSLAA